MGTGYLLLGDRLNKPILEISLCLKKGMSPSGRMTWEVTHKVPPGKDRSQFGEEPITLSEVGDTYRV